VTTPPRRSSSVTAARSTVFPPRSPRSRWLPSATDDRTSLPLTNEYDAVPGERGGISGGAPTLDEVTSRGAFVAKERTALSETFAERGPNQPTLCEGWQTRDLLQHLVLRDAGPLRTALIGKATAEARVQDAGWADLIGQFRDGPPVGSLFRLPGADAAGNLEEFFVHHEDVRRGEPGWSRRELPAEIEDAIWRRLRSIIGRMSTRRTDVGVHVQRPNGEHATLRAARPGVVVTGPPSELLVFLFGRQRAADVDLRGPAEACDRLRAAKLGF
jgi:uncharacterized protein (TIGR03085 family)